jgi:hypothetical protein
MLALGLDRPFAFPACRFMHRVFLRQSAFPTRLHSCSHHPPSPQPAPFSRTLSPDTNSKHNHYTSCSKAPPIHRNTHLCHQMASLLDQTQHLAHIPTPHIQHLVHTLLRLEADHPARPIDPCIYRLVRDLLAKRALGREDGEIQEFCEAGDRDARIVLRDDADVLWSMSVKTGVKGSRVGPMSSELEMPTYMLNDPLVQLFPPGRTGLTLVFYLLAIRF